MEQLKQVLQYKFWILLGVGVILTFAGWWMTTGALAATIKARKEALTALEGSIPSAPQTIPNEQWSAELAKINTQQQAFVTAASLELWQRQKARMFWPPNVEDFAKQIPIRGEFPTTARELYRTNYPLDAERVWRIIRPVSKFDGSGIVEFPGARFPMRRWGELAPTSAEMWDAQEDLWLLEPLLESIRDLNGDENATRLDAAVFVINRLELVGGQRGQPIDAPSSGGGADPMGGGFGADAGAMPQPTDRGLSGEAGGSLAGAKFAQVAADFNYKEEFGDGGDPPWKSGGGGGMRGNAAEPFGEGGGGGDAAGATESTYRRYVDDDPALPYKTRGFYLSVIMDHRRVPELVAALTANGKSDWPVEIVRVQVARINSDDSDFSPQGGTPSSMGLPGDSFTSSESYQDPSFGAGMPEGFGDGGGAANQGFASELANPMGTDNFNGALPTNSNAMAFQNVLRDPYVAKVALCGLIYIYNPVEPPPVTETAPAEASPTEAMPADGTAPAAEPAPEAGTDPAAPATTTDPAAPTPGDAAAPPASDAATNPTPPPAETAPPK